MSTNTYLSNKCRLLLISIIPFLVTGCSTVYTYKNQSEDAFDLFRRGLYQSAAIQYEEEAQGSAGRRNKLLWQLETAKAYQAVPNWYMSKVWFSKAENTVREFESDAVLLGRDIFAEGAALASNQNILAYKGRSTDRILMNSYQSLNFLMLGDIEGAAVETRRAMIRQDAALEKYKSYIEKNEGEWIWGLDEDSDDIIKPVYREAGSKITPAAASFINPFTLWLRAIVHHIRGDTDKAAFEIKNILLSGEHSENLKSYLRYLESKNSRNTEAYCFVIFENGLGPSLSESRFDLLLPDYGYTTVVMPKPDFQSPPWREIKILSGANNYYTQTINSTDASFSSEFKANFNKRLIRTAAAWAAKEAASLAILEAQKDESSRNAAKIATGLYKFAASRADLRIWRNCGNEFQVVAFPLKQSLSINMELKSGGFNQDYQRTIEIANHLKNKHMLIYVQGLTNSDVRIHKQTFDI